MSNLNKKRFFEPIKDSHIDIEKYKELNPLIEFCDVISRVNNQSVYIIDYYLQTFLHVSPHPLFLCGYSAEEVKKMGYSFYEKVVSPADLQMLMEINKMSWDLFYKAPPEERIYSRISYDFFLRHKNGDEILVNHKLSPLCLTDDKNIWLGLCIVNYSPNKESGNVVFTQYDENLYYSYNFKNKKIISYNPEKLTQREKDIIRLTMQGYHESDISQKLGISVHTVKNHRRNAQRKLGVTNLASAVGKFNLIFDP